MTLTEIFTFFGLPTPTMAPGLSIALVVGIAAIAWIFGVVGERRLQLRKLTGLALAVGLLSRAFAVTVVLKALPAVVGVELPFVSGIDWGNAMTSIALGVVGLLIVSRLATWSEQAGRAQGQLHSSIVVGKAIRYVGAVIVAVLVAESMGWDLSAILATAGVVGVAVGFAAQTSLSNVIAGVFLLVDRPFEVGDVVEITGQQGVVLELTLLSTRIRTFDNLVVRWPNEVVLKERITNLSKFPARRLELLVRVPVETPLPSVRAGLLRVLEAEPLVLFEPAPEVRLRDMEGNGVTMSIRVWFAVNDLLDGRDAVILAVNAALSQEGVLPRVPNYAVWMPPSDAVTAPAVEDPAS